MLRLKNVDKIERGRLCMKWLLRLLFTFLIIGGWLTLGYMFIRFYLESPQRSEVKEIEIPPNSTLSEIGSILKKHQLIRENWPFRYYAWYKKMTNLKPGFYEIHPNDNLDKIIVRLYEGKQDTVKVTIPEGKTVIEIAEILEKAGFDKEEFLKEVNERTPTYEFEKEIPANPNRKYRLEGYLFPSTYEFKKGETSEKIVKAMLDQFAERMTSMKIREKLKQRDMTVDEWVTFASVIEKEGQVKSEFPQISGVIHNRLDKGMKLEVDATVIYAYQMQGETKKRLYFNDLKINSPFNTYQNKGLPPAPISCPSELALQSVINPAQHDYLFYVTKKDGTGAHYFGRTMDEHQQNINRSEQNAKKVKQ